jgi:hypothetical protein
MLANSERATPLIRQRACHGFVDHSDGVLCICTQEAGRTMRMRVELRSSSLVRIDC